MLDNKIIRSVLKGLSYSIIFALAICISLWILINVNGLNQFSLAFEFATTIVGSLLGGLAAFFAAWIQIYYQNINEKKKENLRIKNLIIMLKAELDYNKSVFNSAKKEDTEGKKDATLSKLNSEAWKHVKFSLPVHFEEEDDFQGLNSLYLVVEEFKNSIYYQSDKDHKSLHGYIENIDYFKDKLQNISDDLEN